MTENIYKDGIKAAVSLITIAGRTAPKAKGMDTITIKALTSAELKRLIKKMKKIGKIRDAKGISMSDAVILVGAHDKSRGLDCGFCGGTCKTHKGLCAYTGIDLGIAVGSMVSRAADMRIDNRIMYTAGFAALKCSLMPKNVKAAFAIPLSVSSKNIFFDR
ncbi:MAG: ferredoxin [Elusimicrobia bacterium HGW-Elusimicrobia-2]|nr:MAG: ferredoxin [Elusimicrobia bacterium HGW-Elusimicrobia-2]